MAFSARLFVDGRSCNLVPFKFNYCWLLAARLSPRDARARVQSIKNSYLVASATLICRTVVLPLQAELQHTCNRSIPSLLGACDGENCFKQSGPRSGGTSERHSHRALPDLKQHGWQQGNPGTASANPGLLNTPYLGRAAVVAGISDAALVKVKPVT